MTTTPPKLVRGMLTFWMKSKKCWFGTIDLYEKVNGSDTVYVEDGMCDGGKHPITAPAEVVCAVVDDHVYTWFMADDPYPTWEDILRAEEKAASAPAVQGVQVEVV